MSNIIMSEEEINEVLNQFEQYIAKRKPLRVVVTWGGVGFYQVLNKFGQLQNVYYVAITARPQVKNAPEFAIRLPSGPIAGDGPDRFGEVLEKYGYEQKDRWGAIGHWNYLFQRKKVRVKKNE